MDVMALAAAGSSPLARGLLRAAQKNYDRFRIIPARAGFTLRLCRRRCWRPDHPRSRGVYIEAGQARSRRPGSSPLARGLPAWTGTGPTPWPDHPRSRGVYEITFDETPLPAGSSPLARGLRHADLGVDLGRRIIPARAGFTLLRFAQKKEELGSSPLARGLHLRILGIPTNPHSTRPLLPSLPT